MTPPSPHLALVETLRECRLALACAVAAVWHGRWTVAALQVDEAIEQLRELIDDCDRAYRDGHGAYSGPLNPGLTVAGATPPEPRDTPADVPLW